MFLRKPLHSDLILLCVAFIWGSTFTIVKEATSSIPPFSFLGIRFLIASIFLGFCLLLKPRLRGLLDRNLSRTGELLGICLFLAYSVQTFGLQYTSAGRTGFITGLSICLVPFIAMMVLGQHLNRYSFLGILLAVFGLAFLFLSPDSLAMNWGDALVGLCAFAFAVHIVLIGKYANAYHPLLLGWVQLFTAAFLNLSAALVFEPLDRALAPEVLFQTQVLQAFFITSLFASVLAYVAQIYCQKYTSPVRAALMFSAEPVFAILTAYWWAGEVLTGWNILGCGLILSGMMAPDLCKVCGLSPASLQSDRSRGRSLTHRQSVPTNGERLSVNRDTQ